MPRVMTRTEAGPVREAPPLNDQQAERMTDEIRGHAETTILEVAIDRNVQGTNWGLHIDCELTAGQSVAIRRVAAALDRSGARLANGRRVVEPTAAIKYLLEQIQ